MDELSTAGQRLDPAVTTVHEAIRRVPGAADVFRGFGVDACCGGELSLAAAAAHHGVDLDRLLQALDPGPADADDER